MTERHPTEQRREEIAEVVLRLLAHGPLESVTTRAVARELGISQPAIFRHFRSREALVLAAVERARVDLARTAGGVLADGGPALARLGSLGAALLAYVAELPGLPRLLFGSVAPAPGPVRSALARVVAMQTALVAELVREAQRDGEASDAVDADHAATLFVGLVQGLVLRWEIGGRHGDPAAAFAPAFALWARAVAAAPGDAPASRREAAPPGPALRSLDVRPILARHGEPMPEILAAVGALPARGALALVAPFRPEPLLGVLARRGHLVTDERIDRRTWLVLVVAGGGEPIEDLRDLEPPEPLERVLAATARLAPGAVYLARLPRFPRMLLPRLRERGADFAAAELADGTGLVRVARPA